MSELMLSPTSRGFESVELPKVVMELARIGIVGEVQHKKTMNGKVWAVQINNRWHINNAAQVKYSVRPGKIDAFRKKPWKVENSRVAIAKRPKW
jgi:hypothetical protein